MVIDNDCLKQYFGKGYEEVLDLLSNLMSIKYSIFQGH